MFRTDQPFSDAQVPKTIPQPVDDGLASHLVGSSIPDDLSLISTQDTSVNLGKLTGLTIVFCYPRTGTPGEAAPEKWNNTPGARGCTGEACNYRDNFDNLKDQGVDAVFGLSVQSTSYQKEVKERLNLTYNLLSDEKLEFVKAMQMPVFEWEGEPLIKRCTLALRDGKIEHIWYPVFPPDENANEVVAWLESKKV